MNVVLALAHQLPSETGTSLGEERDAWGYFQNALSVTNMLLTTQYTLAAVQALLGLSMIILATPHQSSASLFASSAMKLAHKIGLHKQCHDPELSFAEIEQRRKVFWIAYSIDKDISLQTSQPPTQDDEDMDVDLPCRSPNDLIQPENAAYSIFYFRTRLALIQGEIYTRLLSVKASKQGPSELAMTATELKMKLQAWKTSVPVELFENYTGPILDGPSLDGSRHPVYLQLLYFRVLAVIHDALPVFSPEVQASIEGIRDHMLFAPITYPEEARNALKLLNVTPRRKFACLW